MSETVDFGRWAMERYLPLRRLMLVKCLPGGEIEAIAVHSERSALMDIISRETLGKGEHFCLIEKLTGNTDGLKQPIKMDYSVLY